MEQEDRNSAEYRDNINRITEEARMRRKQSNMETRRRKELECLQNEIRSMEANDTAAVVVERPPPIPRFEFLVPAKYSPSTPPQGGAGAFGTKEQKTWRRRRALDKATEKVRSSEKKIEKQKRIAREGTNIVTG